MEADSLESIAAQLAVRVRDDNPEANARWLTALLPDPNDWFRLAFVLAVAVPDDRTWSQLTRWWTHGEREVPLAAREREVLALIGAGKEDAVIADELGISRETVRSHVSHIFAKLNVSGRGEALAVMESREAGQWWAA